MAKCSFLIKDILRKKQDCGILKATSSTTKIKHCFDLLHHENLTIPTNLEERLDDGKSTDVKLVVRHESGGSTVIAKPLCRYVTKGANDKNKWKNYEDAEDDNRLNETKIQNQNRTIEERKVIEAEVTKSHNHKDIAGLGKKIHATDVGTIKSMSSVISRNELLNDANGKVTDKQSSSRDPAKADRDSQLQTGDLSEDNQDTSQNPSLQHLINSQLGHQLRGYNPAGLTLLHPRAVVPGIAGSLCAALPGIIGSDPRVFHVPTAALPGLTGLQSPSLPRNKVTTQGKSTS